MRTIGKNNIARVKELTKQAISAGYTGLNVFDAVQLKCIAMHDIWESAYDEIDRIVGDNYNPHINHLS